MNRLKDATIIESIDSVFMLFYGNTFCRMVFNYVSNKLIVSIRHQTINNLPAINNKCTWYGPGIIEVQKYFILFGGNLKLLGGSNTKLKNKYMTYPYLIIIGKDSNSCEYTAEFETIKLETLSFRNSIYPFINSSNDSIQFFSTSSRKDVKVTFKINTKYLESLLSKKNIIH